MCPIKRVLNGGPDKLSEDNKCSPKTFPMSQKYKLVKLSHATRHLARHANEQFLDQLRSTTTNHYMLRSAYRALLEWLIVTHQPNAEAACKSC
ncbi:hypothetical protein M3Y97_00229100 [Aphelenchoides bicaudatus]|nr:hypothetical protein M3Y97_00229100 [Aphelenchoides bicaudatus]